jgi:hypothetical protein
MYKKTNHIGLKILVISLGLMLTGGFILLFFVILNKNIEDNEVLSKNKVENCEKQQYYLPKSANVKFVMGDREFLWLEIKEQNYTEFWLVNSCSGNIIRKVKFIGQ